MESSENAPQTEGADAEGAEAGASADEERTDREDGGPTADENAEGDATGSGTGTRDSQFDAHE